MPTKHTNNTNETDIFFSEISRLFAACPPWRVFSAQISYSWEGRKSSQDATNLAYSIADFADTAESMIPGAAVALRPREFNVVA